MSKKWIRLLKAHGNVSVAYSEITLEDGVIKYVLQLDMYDMMAEINPDDPDTGATTAAVLGRFISQHRTEINERLLTQITLYADHLPLKGKVTGLRYTEKENEVQPFAEAVLEYPVRRTPRQFAMDYRLVFDRDQWHVNYVDLNLDTLQKQAVLIAQIPAVEAGKMDLPDIFKQFILLGLEKSSANYVSVLLVLLLLTGTRTLRQSFKAAAAFAAGQSLTLILSGLQLLSLPERIISPLMALSLVYMAVHVFLYRDSRRTLFLIAAGLGLLHGCGYAGALTGLKPDAGYFVSSVLAFYTGTEFVLILIVLILALAAAYLRKWNKLLPTLALNPGADESRLNFTWFTPGQPAASIVQMAKKADVNGGAFPSGTKVMTFTGAAVPATTVTDSVYYSNKVTATGLANQTQYVYRVGDGSEDNWSPVYDYATQDPTNYTLMFVGDPQIGSSGSVTNDTYGWTKTLNQAVSNFPNFSFIMSAGDQIENKSSTSLETEYEAFESPAVLRNLPIATVVGNHDVNVNYKYHYNVPNESTLGIMKDTRNKDVVADNSYGGDYYYTYGDTLFMVLDTNNSNGAEHSKFMQDTVAAVPDTKWRIVTFHHDIYGGGQAHSTEQVVLNLRAALFPTLDALDVDMIFMGHDHSYVRTYVMNGDNVQGRQLVDSQGRDVNPNGSTYVTANSASGSKYYELNTTPERYSASRSQLHTPTFSTIKVTPSSLTVDTYRSDTLEKLDTYGFVKEPESVEIHSNTTAQKDTTAAIDYNYA
ncbi:hypothetical protein KC345_g10639, partial [Hortaea werneckii]